MRPPLGPAKQSQSVPASTERSHYQPLTKNEPSAAARRPARPAARRCRTKPIRPAPAERSHHQPLPNEPNAAARRHAPSHALLQKKANPVRRSPNEAIASLVKRNLHERRLAAVLTFGHKTQPSAPPAWPLEKTNPLWRAAKENKGVASPCQSIFRKNPARRAGTPRTRPRTVAKQSQSASDPYQTKPIARRQPARLAPPWRSACSSNSHPVTKGN